MRMLSRLVIVAIIFPIGASADKVKEVIISGQTAPIDVQIMPDVQVNVVTVPTPPARARGFELTIDKNSVLTEYAVPRDSTLRFVNVTFELIGPSEFQSIRGCQLVVSLRFPPINDGSPLKLAELVIRGDRSEDGFVPMTGPASAQFLTGDLSVPAGSVIMLERSSFVPCIGNAYGILFELE